jgi:ankyrin repeat protein
VPDARGRTPLHEASYNGHVGAVDALLQQEAVADWLHTATDATGATALQWAVAGGAEAAVERLVGAAVAVAGDSVDATRSHLEDLNMSYLLCKAAQVGGLVRREHSARWLLYALKGQL